MAAPPGLSEAHQDLGTSQLLLAANVAGAELLGVRQAQVAVPEEWSLGKVSTGTFFSGAAGQ